MKSFGLGKLWNLHREESNHNLSSYRAFTIHDLPSSVEDWFCLAEEIVGGNALENLKNAKKKEASEVQKIAKECHLTFWLNCATERFPLPTNVCGTSRSPGQGPSVHEGNRLHR